MPPNGIFYYPTLAYFYFFSFFSVGNTLHLSKAITLDLGVMLDFRIMH